MLLFLLYRKLRPYIKGIGQIIHTIRQFQSGAVNHSNRANDKPEKLVCCETCGTWVPIGRTLSSSSDDALFCSAECFKSRKVRL